MDAGSRGDPAARRARVLPAVYAGAASLAAPLLRLLLVRRARRGKEIAARLGERRGLAPAPRPPGRLLWLHAASVGESVSLLPLLSALAAAAPDLSVLLTTGTVTSAALLARRLPELGLEGRVRHSFAPLDVPRWAGRFLDHWHPDAAGFVESEIWPNLLAASARRGIPVMLLNARLSPAARRPGRARRGSPGVCWAASRRWRRRARWMRRASVPSAPGMCRRRAISSSPRRTCRLILGTSHAGGLRSAPVRYGSPPAPTRRRRRSSRARTGPWRRPIPACSRSWCRAIPSGARRSRPNSRRAGSP